MGRRGVKNEGSEAARRKASRFILVPNRVRRDAQAPQVSRSQRFLKGA